MAATSVGPYDPGQLNREVSNMPEELQSAQEPVRPLSPRELAILRRLTTGATSKNITRDLGICEAVTGPALGGPM